MTKDQRNQSARPFVGIDLGTTNSCVATIAPGERPVIIENKQGERTTPSVVCFRPDSDEPIVGAPAKRLAITNPGNTVFAVKRLIGRRFADSEVQELARTLPYAVLPAANGDAWVEAGGSMYPPTDISAIVLGELRRVAEAHFGSNVSEAVITVPAYFGGEQRRATIEAAELAGLEVRRLVNEPTAAALGYGAHRSGNKRFAICDLGGGTFDVSVVVVEGGVIEVISTHGSLFLGGDDFDRAIVEHIVEDVRVRHGVEVSADPMALSRVRFAVSAIKHTLSAAKQADIVLPHLAAGEEPLNYERTVRREEIEGWTKQVAERMEAPCREAIARCGLRMQDIDAVILVGGMTRMPLVQRVVTRIFGRKPLKVVNPDEIVAIGAATQCAILEGQLREVVLLDVTAQALSLASPKGLFTQVIPKNATIPTREARILIADAGRAPTFDVLEGDAPSREDNRLIGRYRIESEELGGVVTYIVELTVDVDGILRVVAREFGSNRTLPLRLVAGAGTHRVKVVNTKVDTS